MIGPEIDRSKDMSKEEDDKDRRQCQRKPFFFLDRREGVTLRCPKQPVGKS